jgi:cytochrome c553
MKKLLAVTVLLGCAVGVIAAIDTPALGQDGKGKAKAEAPTSPNYPAWAYAIPPAPPPGATPPAPVNDDGKMLALPGTNLQFTFNKVRGRLNNETPDRVAPADWYPEDHPTMPKIVAEGDNARGIIACALCHLPPGKGRPENAPPMANGAGYTVQQLNDFKNGLRRSADPRKGNTNNMINFAKQMTGQEMRESAAYYAAQKWTPWIRVVESAQAPKVRSQAGMWIPLTGADSGMDPIGMRIIETPENPEYAEKMRSARSGFVAYVPVGSVAKGQQLVTNGDPSRGIVACTVCHGGDLHGVVPAIPGIAGRSPSYIARQLFDFQQGARNGSMGALMKPVVTNMTNEDFVNITAYLASRPAQAQQPTFTTAAN